MNKLGFGFLRLPQIKGNRIDWPLLEAMVDEFLSSGGTYFDTAYTYLDGMSEAALKKAVVERHPRASFQIADKLPSWKVCSRTDCDRYFREQCERCGVNFFDVYLLHWLNHANYAIAEQYDEFGFLNRLKAEGRIGKTGFSYHGDAAAKECPKGIAIPDYFRIYNGYSRFPSEGWKIEPVYAAIAQANGKASDCVHCRACERNCPQRIPIAQWLEKVAEALE